MKKSRMRVTWTESGTLSIVNNAFVLIDSEADQIALRDALNARYPLERWEPVEDDKAIVDIFNPYRGVQQQKDSLGIFDDNRLMTESVNLPDNIRLCRKV